MGWPAENIIFRPCCRAVSTVFARENRRLFFTCPDDDRKYPSREPWSELHRDDRMAAERASHPPRRDKFSLLSWQAALARAALLHSCSDQQRMLIRRMQGRRSRLQIGPTSRTRDSVWFLFPCRDVDPVANLSKSYSPTHFIYFSRAAIPTQSLPPIPMPNLAPVAMPDLKFLNQSSDSNSVKRSWRGSVGRRRRRYARLRLGVRRSVGCAMASGCRFTTLGICLVSVV